MKRALGSVFCLLLSGTAVSGPRAIFQQRSPSFFERCARLLPFVDGKRLKSFTALVDPRNVQFRTNVVPKRFMPYIKEWSDFSYELTPVEIRTGVHTHSPKNSMIITTKPKRLVVLQLTIRSSDGEVVQRFLFSETQFGLRTEDGIPSGEVSWKALGNVLNFLTTVGREQLKSQMKRADLRGLLAEIGVKPTDVENLGKENGFPDHAPAYWALQERLSALYHPDEVKEKINTGKVKEDNSFIGAHSFQVFQDPYHFEVLKSEEYLDDGSLSVELSRRLDWSEPKGVWKSEAIQATAQAMTFQNGRVVRKTTEFRDGRKIDIQTKRLRIMVNRDQLYVEPAIRPLPSGVVWNGSKSVWWEVDYENGKPVRSGPVDFSSKKRSTVAPENWTRNDIDQATRMTADYGRITRVENQPGKVIEERRMAFWRDPDDLVDRQLRYRNRAEPDGAMVVVPPRDEGGRYYIPPVEWIVKLENGVVTAGYPAGTLPDNFDNGVRTVDLGVVSIGRK